ncbi:hypothetical protein TrLO_g9331 [Triparma laevis f. longispina]|uniref:Protein YIF1 n=1 Tax=Triparma laevis f. longispina TaxID=1714387 RepID=A0A9W7DTR2_9STRA|nr:hypothetical protein TrLO_g9331 [Triparma laevis f. longispina]
MGFSSSRGGFSNSRGDFNSSRGFNNNSSQPTFNTAAAAASIISGTSSQSQMLDLGLSAGSTLASQTFSKFTPQASGYYESLRYYFGVSHVYVAVKLKGLVVPWFKKDWKRLKTDQGFAKPNVDPNAPDLYIPTMSLVTYVLLSGLLTGTGGEFTPDVLQSCILFALGTQFLEVACIRVAYYALEAPCEVLDVMCYSGYKYFGLCINQVIGLIFGYWMYNLSLVVTAGGMGYFTLKTYGNNLSRRTSEQGPKREFVVLGFAGMQVVVMWFLGDTKYLS